MTFKERIKSLIFEEDEPYETPTVSKEVITCQYCRYYDSYDRCCLKWNQDTDEWDFCSYAEGRKTNNV